MRRTGCSRNTSLLVIFDINFFNNDRMYYSESSWIVWQGITHFTDFSETLWRMYLPRISRDDDDDDDEIVVRRRQCCRRMTHVVACSCICQRNAITRASYSDRLKYSRSQRCLSVCRQANRIWRHCHAARPTLLLPLLLLLMTLYSGKTLLALEHCMKMRSMQWYWASQR